MKSILVHLDASPRAAVRLAWALRLALRHGAELTAIYAVLPTLLGTPWATGDGMAAAAQALEELETAQRDRARTLFARVTATHDAQWLDAGTTPYWELLRKSLTCDLVVLGQDDDNDLLTGPLPPGLVPSFVLDSGKPTLVVPNRGSVESNAFDLLVAWKPTREAARAVSAALPFLRRARQVHLAAQAGDDPNDDDQTAAVEHWLGLHGVTAPIRSHCLGPGEVGDGLLNLAADHGVDLLVMGCYGHSRMREWVLGGTSRDVLRSMTLPVLMVH
ncbi:universal stress protein [Ideonella sp. A 288]|uniref:universal stress protein n=1 Tax=Ideonella sp. A 288 TaxID=1962181 RepID=UPI000B4BF1B2|nr:universal stress protein [Ideonella sp. A 288]